MTITVPIRPRLVRESLEVAIVLGHNARHAVDNIEAISKRISATARGTEKPAASSGQTAITRPSLIQRFSRSLFGFA
jgi:hypothetical protein